MAVNTNDTKNISEEELQEWKEWAEEYERESNKPTNEEGGAGDEGTDELTRNYINATPGQTLDNEHNHR